MKIYIDITNVIIVDFVTGIQRVVRNVVLELLKLSPKDIVLVSGNPRCDGFNIVDSDKFCDHFSGKEKLDDRREMITTKHILPTDIKAGDVFFDLDSGWNSEYRRSSLLPILKSHGVKVVAYIYDIIPIRYPQFCHVGTIFRFMDYIGSYLQFGDMVITSTKSVLDDVYSLKDEIGTSNQLRGGFSWLGSDFKGEKISEEPDKEMIRSLSDKKYVLYVGTLEPRKNLGFLLDAFDHRLFDENICLVYAGRIGWNVDELVKRINSHPLLGKQFYHFQGLNDCSIDYLYKHAIAVAYPTYDEGFGLPVVEAIERKTPVITTDRPVLSEVGRDFADYFPLNDENAFCEIVHRYATDDRWRNDRIANLDNYSQFTWKDTAKKILDLLGTLESEKTTVKKNVSQMVMLTARPEAVSETLKYIDNYMPFISEVVLCCPDKVEDAMQSCYQGRMHIRTLTDSKVLNGRKLPEDHQARNTFLRACAILGDELNDVFIMSDDDYRPLKTVKESFFVNEDKYNAYYCYDLEDWKAVDDNVTSFDRGIFKTREFLSDNNLPTRMYSSHMSQIIDRDIYRELLSEYPECMTGGYDEWSIYFNYLQSRYPNQVETMVYQTLCWPGLMTSWDMKYIPDQYSFENYYEELYQEGNLLNGLPQLFTEGDNSFSDIKIQRYHDEVLRYKRYRDVYEAYCHEYEVKYHELPSFGVVLSRDSIEIITPKYLVLSVGGFVRIPFFVIHDDTVDNAANITYSMTDNTDGICIEDQYMNIDRCCDFVRLPVYGGCSRGVYYFQLKVITGITTMSKKIEVLCI